MQPPVPRAFLAHLAESFNNEFAVAGTVTVPMREGECSEERGDDLRLWCRMNCEGRYQQVGRGAADVVKIAFETLDDAVLFRMAS